MGIAWTALSGEFLTPSLIPFATFCNSPILLFSQAPFNTFQITTFLIKVACDFLLYVGPYNLAPVSTVNGKLHQMLYEEDSMEIARCFQSKSYQEVLVFVLDAIRIKPHQPDGWGAVKATVCSCKNKGLFMFWVMLLLGV